MDNNTMNFDLCEGINIRKVDGGFVILDGDGEHICAEREHLDAYIEGYVNACLGIS